MFFIKKLFRIVNSSPAEVAEPQNLPDPVKEEADETALICDNRKSRWARKGIHKNSEHLPLIDIEV